MHSKAAIARVIQNDVMKYPANKSISPHTKNTGAGRFFP